ncbi:MAG: hypothetical protein H0X43_11700 [Nitrosospira sp.]|nr:hypothetical protein [Nitrosospira sp.]
MTPSKRFCIFCGNTPTNKNKEHVLPQWLISLTGDPKRVVNFGMNHNTGKIPRFDWSSFVFPSCRLCNEKYSELENQAKSLILRLIVHNSLSARDYILLLDWLDKVRIGLWLGYSYLHNNPTKIPPKFHINSRIGQKDRMIAVYTIDTALKGLNTFGAETLGFQLQPSCFLLKINNICLLNMSWDFMCAARCGFPFPKTTFINNDALLECSDYKINHKVKHPVIRRRLIKPAVHLYQPIIQAPLTIDNFPNDVLLRNKLIIGSTTKGFI